jgi:chitin disaccharide deacetylase
LTALTASAKQNLTFAERPGWKKGDRVVILHVDDAGMSFIKYWYNQRHYKRDCHLLQRNDALWVPMMVRFLKENLVSMQAYI